MMHSTIPDPYGVWQRVHPTEPQEQRTLQMLLQQLRQDHAFLMKQNAKEARVLVQEYANQIQCLRGILVLSGGNVPRHSPAPLQDHSLKRCYDHGLQRLAAYQLRCSDPVYSPVFRDLAQQTEHHCRLITQVLGSQR